MKYIDAEKLLAEIQRRREICADIAADERNEEVAEYYRGKEVAHDEISSFVTSLQQEQPEVDLEKLGGIARHLIAVKDHEEDMRLDEGEWLLLERIGYPERLNARKK